MNRRLKHLTREAALGLGRWVGSPQIRSRIIFVETISGVVAISFRVERFCDRLLRYIHLGVRRALDRDPTGSGS
jgi:hypothetical protein